MSYTDVFKQYERYNSVKSMYPRKIESLSSVRFRNAFFV